MILAASSGPEPQARALAAMKKVNEARARARQEVRKRIAYDPMAETKIRIIAEQLASQSMEALVPMRFAVQAEVDHQEDRIRDLGDLHVRCAALKAYVDAIGSFAGEGKKD